MIREILKAETLKDHEYLEDKFNILLSKELTKKTYLALLKHLYLFHLYFEKNLEELSIKNKVIENYLSDRKKSDWLKHDIDILTESSYKVDLGEKSDFHFKDFSNIASLMGAIYVLEGATLGGQIITKKLRAHENLLINEATRFYAGYHENTGKMWRDYLTLLESYPWESYGKDKAVSGAKAIFKDINYDLS